MRYVRFVRIGLVFLFILILVPNVQASEKYIFTGQWGTSGPGNGQFNRPEGVAVDNSGNILVTETYNARVQKFDSSGTYLNQWGSQGNNDGQFTNPMGIAVDKLGNIYVTDAGNNRVQKFDSSTTYLTQWGSSGSGDGQFNLPVGITVDLSDNIYVADVLNNRIQKFNSYGIFLAKYSGGFRAPTGVAVDDSGNMYVSDTNNDKIKKFDSAGTYVTQWDSTGGPWGIALDGSDNVFVTDANSMHIQKFDPNGNFLTQWGDHDWGTKAPGLFNSPVGIAIDSSGFVYVSDYGNNRIQKFSKFFIPQSLVVTSYPPGAEIWIDSKNTGQKTPFTFRSFELGTHEVVVKLKCYITPDPTIVNVLPKLEATTNFILTSDGTCIPEFPSTGFPVIMVFGVLGAVLFMRRRI
jgi:streptogramin lyase